MSTISRRYLLRFTAATLATLGLSQLRQRKVDRLRHSPNGPDLPPATKVHVSIQEFTDD